MRKKESLLSLLIALGLTGLTLADVVRLSWDPATTTVPTGDNIYRSVTSGQDYKKLNSKLVAHSSVEDRLLKTGFVYYYVVTAVSDAGVESGYSEERSVDLRGQPSIEPSWDRFEEVLAGSPSEYKLSLANRGDATNRSPIEMVLGLPTGAVFLGASGDSWSCLTVVAEEVACRFAGTLSPGNETLLEVSLWLTSGVQPDAVLFASAGVEGIDAESRQSDTERLRVRYPLYIPSYSTEGDLFSSLSISNSSSNAAEVELVAFGAEGSEKALPENPTRILLTRVARWRCWDILILV